MGCHSHLQGNFLAQGLNLGLLHCRQILYCMSHQGSPLAIEPAFSPCPLCRRQGDRKCLHRGCFSNVRIDWFLPLLDTLFSVLPDDGLSSHVGQLLLWFPGVLRDPSGYSSPCGSCLFGGGQQPFLYLRSWHLDTVPSSIRLIWGLF